MLWASIPAIPRNLMPRYLNGYGEYVGKRLSHFIAPDPALQLTRYRHGHELGSECNRQPSRDLMLRWARKRHGGRIRRLALGKLLDQCRPQTPTFIGTLKRRLNHDELRARIDQRKCADHLRLRAQIDAGAGKQPQKIAIAEIAKAATRAAHTSGTPGRPYRG